MQCMIQQSIQGPCSGHWKCSITKCSLSRGQHE